MFCVSVLFATIILGERNPVCAFVLTAAFLGPEPEVVLVPAVWIELTLSYAKLGSFLALARSLRKSAKNVNGG